MELKDMTMEQLEERKSAIATEIESPDADLDALEAEARGIKEEKNSAKPKRKSAMPSATLWHRVKALWKENLRNRRLNQ